MAWKVVCWQYVVCAPKAHLIKSKIVVLAVSTVFRNP